MEIALIVALSLLTALGLGSFAIEYSYSVNTKAKIFTKPKFPIMPIVSCSILLVCLIIFLALICQGANRSKFNYYNVDLSLSVIIVALTIAHIIWMVVVYAKNQKNKIDYLNLASIDWKEKEDELAKMLGNIEAVKQEMSKAHPQFYNSMLEHYKTILLKLSTKNFIYSESVADIVTFNELFSHKWSQKMNLLQMLLTVKFCSLLQKNPCQK